MVTTRPVEKLGSRSPKTQPLDRFSRWVLTGDSRAVLSEAANPRGPEKN
jgi:hypothetical protein